MRIAILGGGHGCYAAAADLSEGGHHVGLWRRDGAALAATREAGSIRLKDEQGARDAPLALATADIGEAMRDAELIVIPSPAIAQIDIARAMAAHLVDGQVVFLPPGTFGSYLMSQAVRAHGGAAHVAGAETGTLPYLARKHGERAYFTDRRRWKQRDRRRRFSLIVDDPLVTRVIGLMVAQSSTIGLKRVALSRLARSAGVVNASPQARSLSGLARQACPRRRASPATNARRGGQAVSQLPVVACAGLREAVTAAPCSCASIRP